MYLLYYFSLSSFSSSPQSNRNTQRAIHTPDTAWQPTTTTTVIRCCSLFPVVTLRFHPQTCAYLWPWKRNSRCWCLIAASCCVGSCALPLVFFLKLVRPLGRMHQNGQILSPRALSCLFYFWVQTMSSCSSFITCLFFIGNNFTSSMFEREIKKIIIN